MSKYKDGGMKKGGEFAGLPLASKRMAYPDPYSDCYMEMKDDVAGIDEQIKADRIKGSPGYKPAKLN